MNKDHFINKLDLCGGCGHPTIKKPLGKGEYEYYCPVCEGERERLHLESVVRYYKERLEKFEKAIRGLLEENKELKQEIR